MTTATATGQPRLSRRASTHTVAIRGELHEQHGFNVSRPDRHPRAAITGLKSVRQT